MLVLGIESTCDETGCAIVEDGRKILSNIVSSQTELHEVYGGVVPELASRRHIEIFPTILKQALAEADVTLKQIDLIAVAKGPGLIGALLVGLNFAKGLALSQGIPFVGVNHVKAHLTAAMMEKEVPFPALGLIVSGGHTALVVVKSEGEFELIGQTQNDAIGETFDKVATMLGLKYPGGPKLELLAKGGNPLRFPLKIGRTGDRPYDFSFSGLKTAMLYLIKGQNGSSHGPDVISEEEKKDAAASFQHVAFTDIANKATLAAKEFGCKSIIVGGGVSRNLTLRIYLEEKCQLPIFWPQDELCLDNGAMIASHGYFEYKRKGTSDPFDLEALPRIPIGEK